MNQIVQTERTRLRRVHERGSYDRETVYAILDAGMICHVGYIVDGMPYVTPTICWREKDRVFWHGSSASRMLRHQAKGASVCLTVSHLDGLVLARSGFHHSVNYRAVMIFGEAELVSDPEAKARHLERFIEGLFPGRWAELRPMTEQELKATSVLSMTIDEASAKVRAGPPKDDEEDYALPIWAGVLPLKTTVAEPEDDGRVLDGVSVPDYLARFSLG